MYTTSTDGKLPEYLINGKDTKPKKKKMIIRMRALMLMMTAVMVLLATVRTMIMIVSW